MSTDAITAKYGYTTAQTTASTSSASFGDMDFQTS